ncbi:MAG: DUF3515 family protein [Frankiaceae bacterium]|nr:DUF3515 family protein [Frankiaceae bacterium]
MPRRPPLRRLFLAAAALGLAACTSDPSPAPQASGPVDVPAPSGSAALVVSACAALLSALPDELDADVRRRPVSGDAARTAAWGDPPVTLQCGVPLPGQERPPLFIDGFPLVTDERGDAVTYTTSDRAVNVSVRVPKSYDEQVYLVQDLIPLLKKLPSPKAVPGA